ncbi:MAG TPA: rhomboid family intramembrane serine protease [Candidatus Binatia bacterium]|nr:rhomboid family intramembrane serine protease [Candidatus Binatia bacterium]
MIPLRDENPTRKRSYITLGLILTCFAVFGYELFVQATGGDDALDDLVTAWGVVPDKVTASFAAGQLFTLATATLVTSLFLHASWLHVLGNMLYLWIFGNNIEDRFGHLRYLAFYLAAGIAAGLTQVAADPHSTVPLVGASGAIAGLLGAYLVLYPGARIESIVFLGFFYQLLRVPAVIVLGFWFVLQLIDGLTSIGSTATSGGGVAVFAHIGGFGLGLLVGLAIRGAARVRRPAGGPAGALPATAPGDGATAVDGGPAGGPTGGPAAGPTGGPALGDGPPVGGGVG